MIDHAFRDRGSPSRDRSKSTHEWKKFDLEPIGGNTQIKVNVPRKTKLKSNVDALDTSRNSATPNPNL